LIKELQSGSVPNQLFVWAMGGMPYETQMAAPVPGASNYLAQLAPRLVTMLNTTPTDGRIPSQSTWANNEIIVGMPFLNPHLRAVREPAGDFLFGSLFPTPHRTNPRRCRRI